VSIGRLGLNSADRILDGVRAECPDSSGPLRELAGVRPPRTGRTACRTLSPRRSIEQHYDRL